LPLKFGRQSKSGEATTGVVSSRERKYCQQRSQMKYELADKNTNQT